MKYRSGGYMNNNETLYHEKQRLYMVEFLYIEEKSNNEYLTNIYEGWKRKIKVNLIVLGVLVLLMLLFIWMDNELRHSMMVLNDIVELNNEMMLVFGVFEIFFMFIFLILFGGSIAALYKILRSAYKLWLNGNSQIAMKYCKRIENKNISALLFKSNLNLSKYMYEINELKKKIDSNMDNSLINSTTIRCQ